MKSARVVFLLHEHEDTLAITGYHWPLIVLPSCGWASPSYSKDQKSTLNWVRFPKKQPIFIGFFPHVSWCFTCFPPFLWPEIPLKSTKPSVLIAFRNLSSPLFNEATLLIPDLTVRSCVLCEDDFLQQLHSMLSSVVQASPNSVDDFNEGLPIVWTPSHQYDCDRLPMLMDWKYL